MIVTILISWAFLILLSAIIGIFLAPEIELPNVIIRAVIGYILLGFTAVILYVNDFI